MTLALRGTPVPCDSGSGAHSPYASTSGTVRSPPPPALPAADQGAAGLGAGRTASDISVNGNDPVPPTRAIRPPSPVPLPVGRPPRAARSNRRTAASRTAHRQNRTHLRRQVLRHGQVLVSLPRSCSHPLASTALRATRSPLALPNGTHRRTIHSATSVRGVAAGRRRRAGHPTGLVDIMRPAPAHELDVSTRRRRSLSPACHVRSQRRPLSLVST